MSSWLARWQPQRHMAADDISALLAQHRPCLVLLGKTGAGKSSLIAALTGDERINIGLGFKACTEQLERFDFPDSQPLLSFLDSRGLGEAYYDASALAEDLAQMQQQAQGLVVVMRSQDPLQDDVLTVLQRLSKGGSVLSKQPLLLVFSHHLFAANQQTQQQQQGLQDRLQQRAQAIWPQKVKCHRLDLSQPRFEQASAAQQQAITQLHSDLIEQLPMLAQLLHQHSQEQQESAAFVQVKSNVMRYAMLASASDSLPLVGFISVPSLHLWLLSELAEHFDQPWGWADKQRFFTLLGSSVALNYGLKIGSRQLGKLIPSYGQTIGTGISMALSYSLTYALGRAASWYFYNQQQGVRLSGEQLRQHYQQGLFASNNTSRRPEQTTHD